tara:strand:- start:650 stop:1267 length:618 start_codon:yes stop_codon:yes gene_type:complete
MYRELNEKSLISALSFLRKADPDLKKIIENRDKKINLFQRPSGFVGIINLIVEQQLSIASAKAIFLRLKRNIIPFTPKQFCLVKETVLKSAGLSPQKIEYCKGISKACLSKELDFKTLDKMTNEKVEEELTKLKGIGQWTAQCYLMGCMSRIDAWPSSDLGLQVAVQKLKKLKERPKKLTIDQIADQWKPFRSVAALILWSSYDQ